MNSKAEAENRIRIWPTVGLVVALMLGLTGCVLFYLNRGTAVPASWGADGGNRNHFVGWFNTVQMGLIVPLLTGLFGNLILRRRVVPRMGGLFLGLSLLASLMNFMPEYAIFGAYTRSTPLPGTLIVAWVNNFAWVLVFALVLYLLAVFPNGRFLTPRWRIFILGMLALFFFPLLAASIMEAPLSSAYQIANPFFSSYPEGVYNLLFNVGVPSMFLSIVAVLAAVLLRYRRSQGRERQQMKWLLSGVALMTLAVGMGFFLSFDLGISAGDIMVNGSMLWPLTGIGVALLRHRLYDIDIIIRRTMLYTAVSASLALVYFGTILLLQTAFSSVVAARSPLVIVVSTLISVALFNPLRLRLQTVIDRRFFRQKYDAQQVLAQFAQTARDEVAMNVLQAKLLEVIEETLQPEQISVWVKPGKRLS